MNHGAGNAATLIAFTTYYREQIRNMMLVFVASSHRLLLSAGALGSGHYNHTPILPRQRAMKFPSRNTLIALTLGLGYCSVGLMILRFGGFGSSIGNGSWTFHGSERLMGLVYLSIGSAVLYFYFCD